MSPNELALRNGRDCGDSLREYGHDAAYVEAVAEFFVDYPEALCPSVSRRLTVDEIHELQLRRALYAEAFVAAAVSVFPDDDDAPAPALLP